MRKYEGWLRGALASARIGRRSFELVWLRSQRPRSWTARGEFDPDAILGFGVLVYFSALGPDRAGPIGADRVAIYRKYGRLFGGEHGVRNAVGLSGAKRRCP